MFLERGLAASTVDQITRAAGVAKGSFYRYFSNKSELVEAIFAPLETVFNGAMTRCEQALDQAQGADQLHQAYTTLAAELATQLLLTPDPVRLYLQECRGPVRDGRAPIKRLATSIDAAAIRITQTALARKLLRPLSPEITALSVVGAVENILVRYLDRDNADLDPQPRHRRPDLLGGGRHSRLIFTVAVSTVVSRLLRRPQAPRRAGLRRRSDRPGQSCNTPATAPARRRAKSPSGALHGAATQSPWGRG